MSQRDKDNTINKLRQFFRSGKSTGGIHRDKTDTEWLREVEAHLQPQIPVAHRCKQLRDLCESDKISRLEDAVIKRLFELTKDLIVSNKPAEQRHIAFLFYQKLIQSQYEGLSLMREKFFNVILNHTEPDDISQRLDLLKTLTDNGKNITNFEENIGQFMLKWIPDVLKAQITQPFLEVLINIIIYNAAHLDQNIVAGLIEHACSISCSLDDTKTVLQCLQLLDAAICYTVFPTETLTFCIVALCRTVNREAYCQTSWRIMKNLLGTHLGHAALLTMCNILNDPVTHRDEALLRGAVFYINMGLWGSTGSVVLSLRCSPSPVLSSFLHALRSQRIIVTYEVVLGLQRLINTSGKELSEPSWDLVCDILKAVADNITYYEKVDILPRDRSIQNALQETITKIEIMLQRNEVATNPETIYNVIEYVCENRTETSVIQLIEYKATKIIPTKPQWLQALKDFMDRFFGMENTRIRINAIHVLNKIMQANRAAYEEEILERIVIPLFSKKVCVEPDASVRGCIGILLLEFSCHCETKRSLELLDIVEKILNRPFDKFAEEKTIILKQDDELKIIIMIIEELIKAFRVKLHRLPTSHTIKIFYMLIGHLEKYYRNPIFLESSGLVRIKIFVWLLSLRANATYHLGYPGDRNNSVVEFSRYISIEQTEWNIGQQGSSAQQTTINSPQSQLQQMDGNSQSSDIISMVSLRRVYRLLIDCLKGERDWSIMQFVLKELPNLLQNKAALRGNDIEALATTILNLYLTKAPIDTFSIGKPGLSDFYSLVLPAIAGLIPYHQYLSGRSKEHIIESLRLCSRHPRACAQALTVALLEMPDIMLRHLPEVLLEMSKMSTTLNVAVPVLEFLSTLNRLPSRRFINFIAVQYMYVFAISIPYTNPHKYDHYTVSLAHHVIAGWFLKCRLPLRRNYVNYIIKGFETNVQVPFDEVKKVDFSAVNEDSSNRKRSSSLTEHGTKNRERPSLHHLRSNKAADAVYNFHMELAETCIDFLARHTFSPCSALPKRLPTAEFLLAGGQAMTWLVGHNLITITTSGCSSNPSRNGLCERCALFCKTPVPSTQKGTGNSSTNEATQPDMTKTETTNDGATVKRYTKTSFQNSGRDSDSMEFVSSSSSSAAPTYHLQNEQPIKFFRQPSNEGRFSNSSGSLEALSRRSSNPDAPESGDARREANQGISGQAIDRSKQTCACSCTGWAEVYVRRPTGNMSWIMRIQNQVFTDTGTNELSLHDLVTLFMPTFCGNFGADVFLDDPLMSAPVPLANQSMPENQQGEKEEAWVGSDNKEIVKADIHVDSQEEKDEEEEEEEAPEEKVVPSNQSNLSSSMQTSGPINIPKVTDKNKIPSGSFSDVEPEALDCEEGSEQVAFDENDTRSRNPVRRVNSSPEMSSNWRGTYNKGPLPTNTSTNILNTTVNQTSNEDDVLSASDTDQQQKKKNFAKDVRVSCEAIPEEISDSTPPKTISFESNKNADAKSQTTTVTSVPSEPAKGHQTEFPVSKQAHFSSTMHPPASLPSSKHLSTTSTEPLLTATHNQPPRKQHSADDALSANQKSDQPTSNNPFTIKHKPSIDIPKLTTKPPQSPTPLSPRLLVKNTGSILSNTTNLSDFPRGRSKTISVVRSGESESRDNAKWLNRGTRSCISPSSLFLQLYHTGSQKNTEQPIMIKQTRTVELLDLIPPFETHKIGVLYVGIGQSKSELEILRNRHGSFRYMEFLQNLGTLVALQQAKGANIFLDMELDGRDGHFTYIWKDEIIQVAFHVPTLMPNKDHDPNCNEKKKHIGNDYVSIIYNESGEDYQLNTIKGQFNYACIIVQPLELNSNRIFIKCKDDVSQFICNTEPKIISDASAPLYARQLALHANMACLVAQSLKSKNSMPYASNWLERLRRIKNLRQKVLAENNSGQNAPSDGAHNSGNEKSNQWIKEDFTQYTQ